MRTLFLYTARAACACPLIFALLAVPPALGQRPASADQTPALKWIDSKNGVRAEELIQRALRENKEFLAARLQIAESRGELRQAGLRPNPSLESSFGTGSPLGSSGE